MDLGPRDFFGQNALPAVDTATGSGILSRRPTRPLLEWRPTRPLPECDTKG
jgi:hypothetical protein